MSDTNAQRTAPLIDRYQAGGAILAYAVAGLSPAHESARVGPGAWSVAEVTAHLLDCDLIFSERIRRALTEDEPLLPAFDRDARARTLGPQAMPAAESAALFAANRRWTARLLRARPDADFTRAGRHPELGRITLAGLLSTATNHVDHHLRTIYALRAGVGVALPPRYSSEALRA